MLMDGMNMLQKVACRQLFPGTGVKFYTHTNVFISNQGYTVGSCTNSCFGRRNERESGLHVMGKNTN